VRRRFSLIPLLPLLLLVASCASLLQTNTASQAEIAADTQRLKAIRQIGSQIETYHDILGHYPLAGSRWGDLSAVVFIGATPATKSIRNDLRGETIELNATLLQQELSRVIKRPVTLVLPPQSAPDSGLNHYRYRLVGNHYELTVFTSSPYPFTHPTDDGRHQLTVTSRLKRSNAINYTMLMDDDTYILASTRPVPNADPSLTLPNPTPADILRFAVADNDYDGVRVAIQDGSPVNPTCAPAEPCLPLVLAARISDLILINQLLSARANPNAADGHGDTPLLAAGNHSNSKTGRQIRSHLLSVGADPNQPNHWGWTPFTSFAATGALDLLKQAKKKGAEINFQPPTVGVADIDHGDTALVAATRYGQYDTVGWLLKHGADPSLTGYDGKTAPQVAEANHNHSIMNLFSTAKSAPAHTGH